MGIGSCGMADAALSSISPVKAPGLEEVEAELGVGAFGAGTFGAEEGEGEAMVMPSRMT